MKPGKGGIRLPDLTPEQKAAGLEKARRRRTLFRQVAAGEHDLQEVWGEALANPHSEWAAVPVKTYLRALPFVGEGKAAAWMVHAGIHPRTRLGQLSAAQAQTLAPRVEQALTRRHPTPATTRAAENTEGEQE